MQKINRKVTYRLYPSHRQCNQMAETLRLHQKLYNAALEQRIDAFQRCRISLGFKEQCAQLTLLRQECPEYAALNAQSEQVTLKRLDLAFAHFFRRVKEGAEKAGFPRFKSLDRFRGWGYKSHGDGWKFQPGDGFVNGTLRLSGVGHIQARGRARFVDAARQSRDPGAPKTVEIVRKNSKWYASITFETCKPYRASGPHAVGIDWGVLQFMTLASADGRYSCIENPRHWHHARLRLHKAQRALSRKKRGSKNRGKAKKILSAAHERLCWKREDFLHQASARIVGSASLIATESLNVKGMTSHGGSYKRGLNRSILDTSPGKFFMLLEYKAADAGIPYVEISARQTKPSQTCSSCGQVAKKKLSERTHDCSSCGLILGRDENAARVILNYALTGFATGREPASSVESGVTRLLKHETPPIPEQAR
jgi:putative transposase